MAKISKEDFELYKTVHENFMKRLKEIVTLVIEVEENRTNYGDITEVEFKKDGHISVSLEENTYNGFYVSDTEYFHYTIPEHYIYDDNWFEEHKKIVEAKREEKRLKDEIREVRAKEIRENMEREKYEELKKKFESR